MAAILDDRARQVTLCPPETLPRKARRAGRPRRRAYIALMIAIIFVGQPLATVLIGALRQEIDWSRVALGSVVAIVPLMVAAFMAFVMRPARGFRRQFVHDMLNLKMCPVCTYSIEGVPVALDGCTVCPECGAAWKLAENEFVRR